VKFPRRGEDQTASAGELRAMASVDLIVDPRQAEAERVFGWRLEELERAGFDRIAARELAERSYVDLHLAIALMRGGCPHDTALRILI
jgi:hypothetical protein